MSMQLGALAEEVFDAAAAQGRAGAESVRQSFGEIVFNPTYPELFFLHGIVDLVAPAWQVSDLERAERDLVPVGRAFRATSRDPATIVSLRPLLVSAGYQHERRLGMIDTGLPPMLESPFASDSRQAGGYEISSVTDDATWSGFERLIAADTADHGWSRVMTEQLTSLYRWRAEHAGHRYFLAWMDGKPLAHVGLYQHREIAYLHGLFTHPSARRRGLGSALTLAMRVEANAIGCNRLTLQCTDDGRLPAYYERLGFRALGEQHIWTRLR